MAPIEIEMVLSPDEAEAFRQGKSAVNQVVQEEGVKLEPIVEAGKDAELSRFFTAQVPGRAQAEKLIARLHGVQGVDGVYIKPPGQPPSTSN